MKKEYLNDYAAKEDEIFQRHVENSLKTDKFPQYPARSRFSKLTEPLMFFDPFSYHNYEEKIWSQIPFAGTLMISLRNVRENDCLSFHGFEPDDIPHLIELAKDKGKVQFGLQTNPSLYEDLDYLDDIFTELKPPLFYSRPFDMLVDKKTLWDWQVTFDQLGSICYFDTLKQMISTQGYNYAANIANQHKGTYLSLKILQWNDIVENLENLMIDDPESASMLFEKYGIMISPKFGSFTPNVNWGLRELKKYDLGTSSLDNVFFPEIGSYIIKKAVLHPYDYHECRNVIDHYDQNQLYTVYESLYRSMQNQKNSELVDNVESINTIMDNAWEDGKKLVGRNSTLKIALDVVMGACGSIASGLLGYGFTGLLAGLGFEVAQKNIPWTSSISDKILRKLQPDYLVNIYDFHRQEEKS